MIGATLWSLLLFLVMHMVPALWRLVLTVVWNAFSCLERLLKSINLQPTALFFWVQTIWPVLEEVFFRRSSIWYSSGVAFILFFFFSARWIFSSYITYPHGIFLPSFQVLRAGFSAPTPIQAQSWPIALKNRDIVAVAKTGSGKTLGYLIPGFIHLKRLQNDSKMGPRVLVLSPTRELATQIHDEAEKFGRSSRISSVVCSLHPCRLPLFMQLLSSAYWYSQHFLPTISQTFYVLYIPTSN